MDGGGGTPIFSYVGSGHFLGLKILNFNILGGFSEFFFFRGGGVYEDFVDIFLWDSHKLDYI